MNEEAINKKAEKHCNEVLCNAHEKCNEVIKCRDWRSRRAGFFCGYEQALKDCEKENAELKEKLKTAYRKGMRHMAKALKDYDRTDGAWTDYFEHTVDKVLQREQLDFEKYGTLADQLTKAKKHIKKLLDCLKQDTNDPQTNYYVVQYMTQAEQFLNSEVEK